MFHDYIRAGNIAWLEDNSAGRKEPLALHILAESNAMCETTRTDIAQLLLSKNCTSRNVQNEEDGNTALHVASKKGRKHFVEFLLSIGSDRNVKNKNNETCCFVAITPAIKKLIRNTTEATAGVSSQTSATAATAAVAPVAADVLHSSMLPLCSRNNLLLEAQLDLLKHTRPKLRKGLHKIHLELMSRARQSLSDAEEYLRQLVAKERVSEHHSDLLNAIIWCIHEQELTLVKSMLQRYVDRLQDPTSALPKGSLNPAFFFAKYCMFKCSMSGDNQVFVSKRERAAAVDCLEVLKLFPEDACCWMTSLAEIDSTIAQLGGVRVYVADGEDSGDDDVNEVADEAVLRWQHIKHEYQQQHQYQQEGSTPHTAKQADDPPPAAPPAEGVVEVHGQAQFSRAVGAADKLVVVDFYSPRYFEAHSHSRTVWHMYLSCAIPCHLTRNKF